MAFTRKFLESAGLTEAQVSAVMEEHVSVTDALKKERDGYKEQAESIPDLKRQIDGYKNGEDWEKKYKETLKAFDDFKKDQSAKETANKIRSEYRKLLIGEKISEEWADKIVKLEDFSGMKLDNAGNLEGVDDLKAKIQKEYAGYITNTETKGAKVDKPPKTESKAMTREDIYKRDEHGRYVLSTEERQKAIAEHLDLFGKGV